jgi:hypothetical protein
MSNIEGMYSVCFKKRQSKAKPPIDILRFACFKIDKAYRNQCSTFNLFTAPARRSFIKVFQVENAAQDLCLVLK